MKKVFSIVVLIVLGVMAYQLMQDKRLTQDPIVTPTGEELADITVIASNLEIPWDIAFLPDGSMLVTERTGSLLHIQKSGTTTEIAIKRAETRGESGLLGVVAHPNFSENRFIYVYMTAAGARGETENRVERYRFADGVLTDEKMIIDKITGATYHDGGRMAFGPDGLLYITTGDATRGAIAQDKNSLGGKILRLKDDGSIPSDNPFGNAVYTYGHRNPQGLAWDASGQLWETEHGPTGESGRCCHDEVNLLAKGGNYGWPTIIGDETKGGMQNPAAHSGDSTWAPASAAIIGNTLYFGGLMGEGLYEGTIEGSSLTNIKKHFDNEYGRIRTVKVGPEGYLYLTTSNRDGRGNATDGDDKIIRVNPATLQ